ncbi:uncharacterized protein LOC115685927 isoform X2 [Syzygium oleosum]|uniref:uncharacterized protein LOC115685927 isoform X2 n=1 Tax=Syzygium oleosum TaxID=219896 RepID=UPI0024BAC626|nr:uncharacterized protein LOC115685927 isoform X2 [Syzygium oleosum]
MRNGRPSRFCLSSTTTHFTCKCQQRNRPCRLPNSGLPLKDLMALDWASSCTIEHWGGLLKFDACISLFMIGLHLKVSPFQILLIAVHDDNNLWWSGMLLSCVVKMQKAVVHSHHSSVLHIFSLSVASSCIQYSIHAVPCQTCYVIDDPQFSKWVYKPFKW